MTERFLERERALCERAGRAFTARFGGEPSLASVAPGRVNIIGEHTDYNGGLAMPAAIDRWVVVLLRPLEGDRVVVHSLDFPDEIDARLDEPLREPCPSWHRYVLGALAVFRRRFPAPHGLLAVVAGDVPVGAGLSSSAAIEVAVMAALRALYGADISGPDLVRMCQQVEHEHLGLASGLLDQMASHLARPDQLMVIDFRDLGTSYVRSALAGWSWVVVDTGVRRELAGSAYKDRVRECAEGLRRVAERDPAVRHFRDIRPEHLLGETGVFARRLAHVISENERVEAATAAVRAGDASTLGRLIRASHESLRDLYQVSCPELDELACAAAAHPACAGGRMVGGGFGGCTINLVRTEAVGDFCEAVSGRYHAAFGRHPRHWPLRLVGGSHVASWPIAAG